MLSLSKKPSRQASQATVTKPEAVEGSLTITAESAASAVIAFPSTDVKNEVTAVLEVIKRIDSRKAGDEKVRARLEDLVRYLVELLEPLIRMDSSQIVPRLHIEMQKLANELKPISALNLDSKPTGVLGRRLSFINRPRNYDEEVNVFTQDLKMALDRYRVAALPLYTISTAEITMLSLGFAIEFSTCDLLPFLDAIIQHERAIDYRLGTVQSVRLYRDNRPGHAGLYEFLLISLLNKGGIENWMSLEPQSGPRRGEVKFATKPEKLIMASAVMRERLIIEDRLLMTRLAVEIKVICGNEDYPNYSARKIFESLAPHGRPISTTKSRANREMLELPLPPLRHKR